MKGKSKCKILKDLRKQIAKENDIEFITSECNYKGDCLGTCPKCEAEVRYLESELEKRKNAGKKIAVAGIAAAFALSAASCDIEDVINQKLPTPSTGAIEAVDGEMPSASAPAESDTETDVSEETECEIEVPTMGDVAVIGEVAEP